LRDVDPPTVMDTVPPVHDPRPGPALSRRAFLRTAGMLVVAAGSSTALTACGGWSRSERQSAETAGARSAALFRQEGCSCCATYADYLRDNGFTVDLTTMDDLEPIRDRHRVPEAAVGCHTSLIAGYVVEGHVPVEAIDRMLSERPNVTGISVVGMPSSSPGMGEPNGTPLEVVSFHDGRVSAYMSVATF
jgi:hypothetical protein